MGVALEVDGDIVEDASWLRKESDHQHINDAELEAGVVEMLVKRRLGVIRDTIAEYELAVSVHFVLSVENKADRMTRVQKRWLEYREAACEAAEVSAAIVSGESPEDAIWAAHLPHHLGVDRTLYLAQQIRKDLSWEQVKTNLAGCEACQCIDPALRGESIVPAGDLAVEENWCQVAIDVTHYGDSPFLSMLDCGLSRFAIWCRLKTESAAQIVTQLCSIMVERGPCYELLLDNSAAFRSAAAHQFADRGGITPEEATFRYNVTPRKETEETSVPSNVLFRCQWQVPFNINSKASEEDVESCFSMGDEVWVKPYPPSCTKQWTLGQVTSVVSKHAVCLDGMPRHVRDVRQRRYGNDIGGNHFPETDAINMLPVELAIDPVLPVGPISEVDEEAAENQGGDGAQLPAEEVELEANVDRPAVEADRLSEQPELPRRLQRLRRRPAYLDDYEC
ncbi:uncharacterized protein [Watersipora subatra]|uniref:uncharacterized protein n=1 Tax=Watersipora subatra TaxID=2589382 RepID=UPI00355BF873